MQGKKSMAPIELGRGTGLKKACFTEPSSALLSMFLVLIMSS